MRDGAPASGSVPAYTVTARVLHWLTAVLVLLMVPLGFVIVNEWGGPLQDTIYDLHKSIGAVLLPLVVVRLVWRLTHPPAPLPPEAAAAVADVRKHLEAAGFHTRSHQSPT